jgi:hypothetical protein
MIRKLLRPPAHLIVLALERTKASPTSLISLSYFVALVTIVAFYLTFTVSQKPYWFKVLTIAGMFLSAFLYEVVEEFSKLKKSSARVFDRYTDVVIIFGTIYIAMKTPYGIVAYDLAEMDFLLLGAAIFFGILLLDYLEWRGGRKPLLTARSQRLSLFAGALLVGLYTRRFEEAYVAGLLALAGCLYLVILRENLSRLAALGEALARAGHAAVLLLYQAGAFLLKKVSLSLEKLRIRAEIPEEVYEEEELPPPGYNFTVVVTDRSSEPITNAEVRLLNQETGGEEVRYTDAQGRTDFSDVAEGQHIVKIEAEGFEGREYVRYISMDSGEVFTLTKPYSDLSIVVTDKEKTTPVASAKVVLKFPDKEEVRASRPADNLGVAYFDGLEIDVYDVLVEASGYRPWWRRINLEEENVVAVNLVKEGQEAVEKPLKEEAPKEEIGLEEILGESSLIEYASAAKVEKVVTDIVEEHLRSDRDVFLVSSPPEIKKYRERFGERIRVINLSAEPSRLTGEEEIMEVSMTNLEHFKPIFEEMPAGSVLIFEPLSNLIFNLGVEPSFKFISKTMDYFSREGLSLICLLNVEGHDDKTIASFRDLFTNIAGIEGERLVRLGR